MNREHLEPCAQCHVEISIVKIAVLLTVAVAAGAAGFLFVGTSHSAKPSRPAPGDQASCERQGVNGSINGWDAS
jgi:hypothetical protein